MSVAKLNAAGICWIAELVDDDFKVKYRAGKLSSDCDFFILLLN